MQFLSFPFPWSFEGSAAFLTGASLRLLYQLGKCLIRMKFIEAPASSGEHVEAQTAATPAAPVATTVSVPAPSSGPDVSIEDFLIKAIGPTKSYLSKNWGLRSSRSDGILLLGTTPKRLASEVEGRSWFDGIVSVYAQRSEISLVLEGHPEVVEAAPSSTAKNSSSSKLINTSLLLMMLNSTCGI